MGTPTSADSFKSNFVQQHHCVLFYWHSLWTNHRARTSSWRLQTRPCVIIEEEKAAQDDRRFRVHQARGNRWQRNVTPLKPSRYQEFSTNISQFHGGKLSSKKHQWNGGAKSVQTDWVASGRKDQSSRNRRKTYQLLNIKLNSLLWESFL